MVRFLYLSLHHKLEEMTVYSSVKYSTAQHMHEKGVTVLEYFRDTSRDGY